MAAVGCYLKFLHKNYLFKILWWQKTLAPLILNIFQRLFAF